MELQQENAELRKENADLETRIVDLKLQLKADKNSDSAASIEQEMKSDIGRAAKFFHVFMSPSISAEAFILSIKLFFLINYITAGTSYCLRTYFPDPEESQETYDACQQYLL
jgi:hypothetical protein